MLHVQFPGQNWQVVMWSIICSTFSPGFEWLPVAGKFGFPWPQRRQWSRWGRETIGKSLNRSPWTWNQSGIMIHWIHIGCIVSEASLKNCGSSFKWIENRNATFLFLRRNSTLDLAAGWWQRCRALCPANVAV